MPRVVLVTSAIAHEGKTTVAVCLGLASVSSGQRVLIIDCDFSRPQVHKVMRVDNDRGLTDVLAGTVALEDAICHATGSPLSVLPAGQATHSAADLLTPDVMGDLLTQLSADYDRSEEHQ